MRHIKSRFPEPWRVLMRMGCNGKPVIAQTEIELALKNPTLWTPQERAVILLEAAIDLRKEAESDKLYGSSATRSILNRILGSNIYDDEDDDFDDGFEDDLKEIRILARAAASAWPELTDSYEVWAWADQQQNPDSRQALEARVQALPDRPDAWEALATFAAERGHATVFEQANARLGTFPGMTQRCETLQQQFDYSVIVAAFEAGDLQAVQTQAATFASQNPFHRVTVGVMDWLTRTDRKSKQAAGMRLADLGHPWLVMLMVFDMRSGTSPTSLPAPIRNALKDPAVHASVLSDFSLAVREPGPAPPARATRGQPQRRSSLPNPDPSPRPTWPPPPPPAEISAFILRELKARAERAAGERVTQAVITVPAYFSEVQRQATREAGVLAGLEVARIINEPTAAALAYEAAGVTGAANILVFDFGGGTFDVSLVNVSGDVVEVRASHGDNHLGGDDIDALLLEDALGRLNAEAKGRRPSPVAVSRLRLACEQLKIDLSSAANATLAETSLPMEAGESVDLTFDLSRREFEDRVEHLLRRTLESVRNVLSQAGLFPRSIDEILLVGGTTRIPAIADLLEREIGKRPRFSVDPDLAVAYGAGVMAARLSGEDQQRILVDITPYTFGSSCVGEVNGEYGPHLFVPVIKAGTPLPARRGQVFYTLQPGQRTVKVEVFQGESNDARENVFVGEFKITGLDEDALDNSPILLNMHLDLDGILTATAIEQHTGRSKSVVIKNTLRPLDEATLEASRRKIAELFPDQAIQNLEEEDGDGFDGEIVEAFESDEADIVSDPTDLDSDAPAPHDGIPSELAQRIRNCRDKLDAVDREDLDRNVKALREATRDADDDTAGRARDGVEDILFYVE